MEMINTQQVLLGQTDDFDDYDIISDSGGQIPLPQEE